MYARYIAWSFFVLKGLGGQLYVDGDDFLNNEEDNGVHGRVYKPNI